MRLNVETVASRVIVTAPRSVSVADAAWSSSVPTAIQPHCCPDDEIDVRAVEVSGLSETIGVEERNERLRRPVPATAD